jgi:pyrroloquinoline quinone biosynthesis protein B
MAADGATSLQDRLAAPGRLSALVLGSAAGGGFPQWNCACRLCALAWAGDPRVRPATQASLAFSADGGAHWLVVGASPDLRQQIISSPQLHPRTGTGRDSPITAVVIVSSDVDGIAGLIVLRERQRLTLLAAAPVLDILRANPVFDVLDSSVVERIPLAPDQPFDAGHGLRLTLLTMPGKIPLYLEDRGAATAQPAATYAARVQAHGRTAIYAPGCAQITDAVRARLATADALFFDGTLFTDTEMIDAGVGSKTGRRMGHVPIDGPDGSLALLSGLPGRRIYVHINNTNPVLLAGSPERAAVEAAGVAIGQDGMEIDV